MNRKAAFFLFLSICMTAKSVGQECLKSGDPQARTTKIGRFNPDDYKGWQKIETGRFSFYAPPELRKKETRCYESCYRYESDSYNLFIDNDPAAWFPSQPIISFPSYCEKWFQIEGAVIWIWHFEELSKQPKYTSGAYFKSVDGNNPLFGMYVTANKEMRDTAEKIFKSVRSDKSKPSK